MLLIYQQDRSSYSPQSLHTAALTSKYIGVCSEVFKFLKFCFCTAGLAFLLPQFFWDLEIRCSCSLALVQISLTPIIRSEFCTKLSSHGYGMLITKIAQELGKHMELVVEKKFGNCQGKREAQEVSGGGKK